MISHFLIKEYLSFKEVQLHFKPGLIVFTGPSGSGKSILLNALLGTTCQYESSANLAELEFNHSLDLSDYGIQSDDFTTFKQLKKGNTRFFINNQSISKKILRNISSTFIRYLSHKDFSDFSKKELLNIVDNKVNQKKNNHLKKCALFCKDYENYLEVKKALKNIELEQEKILEIKEFAQFEVEKIDAIAPKLGEDKELDLIKHRLTKREKIKQSINEALVIFEFEHKVSEALSTLEINSSFFDEAMNDLRIYFDNADDLLEELETLDIESILDRIEVISQLKHRYGSIEKALDYRKKKALELEKYSNFNENKIKLQKEHDLLHNKLIFEANALHVARANVIKELENSLNYYTKALYLEKTNFSIDKQNMDKMGIDNIVIDIKKSNLNDLSSGEFNRLRLALLALKSDLQQSKEGILVLDEIDANLSGEESMSVAHVLTKLAKQYQIFAISHQPQLTSQADQHFMVYKKGNESLVKSLDDNERIDEIARMISGDEINDEAKQFAITLRSA